MSSPQLKRVANVRLPSKGPSTFWDVAIANGKIASIEFHEQGGVDQHSKEVFDGRGGLLAPSLCHAHIHLDKCFLLQHPKFNHLQVENGDFKEAMDMTGEAKAHFVEDDLLERGRQLIEESIHHGVTLMRAFVELDGVVHSRCLDAGLKLKEEFAERCEIQLCAFAQLPLFTGEDGGAQVRKLMAEAAARDGVDVLGSTPYVEENEEKSLKNVEWIVDQALQHKKHLDLHLDYFVEESKQPLVSKVLDIAQQKHWTSSTDKCITLGHCTRLTRFKDHEWTNLHQHIGDLPVSFVGLPTSDLFMMRTLEGLRGTLPIVEMIKKYGFQAAIAINNVGNAFTPQGNCDPLSIASLGVGLYQAGTKADAQILYEAVSSRAKQAIGCDATSTSLEPGEPADFVLLGRSSTDAEWMCRKSIVEVVYNPPASRATIRAGKITSSGASA